jgi:hypothetical protein
VRGVLLLHSFEYDEAIAAFRDAQRLDPGFAMAYWGEALSYNQPLWYNEDVPKARAVLGRLGATAVARAAKAPTAREKGYLEAVERLYGEGDKPARDRAYRDRMAALTAQYPDDNEAAALYALSLLATIPSGQRDPAVSLKAGGIATAILAKNPEHPGAAHYALHAFDDGEHAAMGLQAARTYARIAPASSHARHMPSHVERYPCVAVHPPREIVREEQPMRRFHCMIQPSPDTSVKWDSCGRYPTVYGVTLLVSSSPRLPPVPTRVCRRLCLRRQRHTWLLPGASTARIVSGC